MKIFAKIRAYFIIASVAFYLGVFIIILFFFRKNHHIMRTWVCRRIFNVNRIRYELKGEIDPNAQMIIINHQSFLDIMLLELVHPSDLVWVAKRELFNIRFYGQLVKLPKMIAIDREDKNGLKKLIHDCEDRINDNRVIAIFPEGTRSNKGTMLPFKSGAQFVANKLDLVVQPFVIDQTIGILDVKKMLMNPGTLTITALPSFKVDKENKQWLKETREAMLKVFTRDH